MDKQQLSGLEILEKFKDGIFPGPTMAVTIPMKIMAVDKGSIEFKAVASDKHLNPMGGVHGGFAATVLDSATGTAVHTMLDPGESYGTIDLNVKMLRPVPRGIELRAKGKVIHMSRRLGISDATLTDDDGKIYAHATSTCMILRKEKSSNVTAFKSQEIRTQACLKTPAAVKSIAASNQRYI
jgi:uncharacterized protein (TIGR00369 family)